MEGIGIEIDASMGLVGVSVLHDLLDESDNFGHVLRDPGDHVRGKDLGGSTNELGKVLIQNTRKILFFSAKYCFLRIGSIPLLTYPGGHFHSRKTSHYPGTCRAKQWYEGMYSFPFGHNDHISIRVYFR